MAASLWELLESCHFTEEQRKGLPWRTSGRGGPQHSSCRAAVQRQVQEAERGEGLCHAAWPQRGVPAVWLLDAGVITGRPWRRWPAGHAIACWGR